MMGQVNQDNPTAKDGRVLRENLLLHQRVELGPRR